MALLHHVTFASLNGVRPAKHKVPKLHCFIIHGAENDTLKWCFEYICFYYFLLLGTPKVQWKKKNHNFLKKNVDDTVCLKNTEVTDQGKNTRGLRAILPPKCKKEPSKKKKKTLKIAIDCNVKACSMLQI